MPRAKPVYGTHLASFAKRRERAYGSHRAFTTCAVSSLEKLKSSTSACNLGIADWHGREQIRENLRAFIDTGFTAMHDVVEYRDGGSLKVFRGTVTMMPDDKSKPVVKPVMTHFFYMDEDDPTKVRSWFGALAPSSSEVTHANAGTRQRT
jgi:hypothetical protein